MRHLGRDMAHWRNTGIVNLTNTQCGFSNFRIRHDFRVTKCIVWNRRSGLEFPKFILIPVKLTMPWSEIAVAGQLKVCPPEQIAARDLALMHIAIYDATVAAWDSKYAYKRLRPSAVSSDLTTVLPNPPSPSYPAEHAVAAGAASEVLAYIFPERGEFYYHAFYKEQPDLNFRNREVRNAMYNELRFWMKKGVAGFRLDAVTSLFEDAQLRSSGLGMVMMLAQRLKGTFTVERRSGARCLLRFPDQ